MFLNDKDYYGGFEEGEIEKVFLAMEANYEAWVNGFAPLSVGADVPAAVREFSRTLFNVLKHGTALGRSVDLSRYTGYEGLIGELDRMFEFGGTLVSGTSGWAVTYADRYGNKMLLCNRLWSQFKAVVRKMTIESAATVN